MCAAGIGVTPDSNKEIVAVHDVEQITIAVRLLGPPGAAVSRSQDQAPTVVPGLADAADCHQRVATGSRRVECSRRRVHMMAPGYSVGREQHFTCCDDNK